MQIQTEKSVEPLKGSALGEIERLDQRLSHHFKRKFRIESSLSRPLVSFQANKTRPVYRWYKFKEAFSASLVEYLFEKYKITNAIILDPFAGSGTALFAASGRGIKSDGIELLPIGQQIIATKKIIESEFTKKDFSNLERWFSKRPWEQSKFRVPLPQLRITEGAYPDQTKKSIEKYLGALEKENKRLQVILRFALSCILESISYTRKDGQYLRWDHRSGRRQGEKAFDKGTIHNFGEAICSKLKEIFSDLQNKDKQMSLFYKEVLQGEINLFSGSSLDIMPNLPDEKYDAIITSPPYCNRYDYTRTYALELALLGTSEQDLVTLRQQMVTCTVENRAKDLLKLNPKWIRAISVADHQNLLQGILKYLEDQKAQGKLNNNGIPRMVRGYFYEMACIILECSRVLKPHAPMFMVNDNVRYAGASVSVDMILSNFAEKLGFTIENILVLPNGKGNSSQQMGEHGREPLRKCVYVWRKTH